MLNLYNVLFDLEIKVSCDPIFGLYCKKILAIVFINGDKKNTIYFTKEKTAKLSGEGLFSVLPNILEIKINSFDFESIFCIKLDKEQRNKFNQEARKIVLYLENVRIYSSRQQHRYYNCSVEKISRFFLLNDYHLNIIPKEFYSFLRIHYKGSIYLNELDKIHKLMKNKREIYFDGDNDIYRDYYYKNILNLEDQLKENKIFFCIINLIKKLDFEEKTYYFDSKNRFMTSDSNKLMKKFKDHLKVYNEFIIKHNLSKITFMSLELTEFNSEIANIKELNQIKFLDEIDQFFLIKTIDEVKLIRDHIEIKKTLLKIYANQINFIDNSEFF